MKITTVFAGILFAASGMGASAAPPVEAYGHLPSISDVQISPSGQNMAFVATTGHDERRLVVAKVTGEGLYIAPIGDNKVRGVNWVDDEHVLLMISHTYLEPYSLLQSSEFMSVINIRLKDKTSKVIFRNVQSMMEQVFGYYGTAHIDGHVYGYFGGVTYERHTDGASYVLGHGHPDLYQVDLDTDDHAIVSKGDENIDRWVVSSGVVTAHSEYDERSGKWRLFRGKLHEKLLLERSAPTGELSLLGLGRDSATLLVEDRSGEPTRSAKCRQTERRRTRSPRMSRSGNCCGTPRPTGSLDTWVRALPDAPCRFSIQV